jgi:CofD-related protein of GAK system
MPEHFDLRGASIGNLILAGGYLNQGRHIDPVIYVFSRLAEVRGVVRPITSTYLHLAAELEDGQVLVGQHLVTGKEVTPIRSRVKRVFLTKKLHRPDVARPRIRNKMRDLIRQAELICYPMGSFYSSLIANLLPAGVGQAISETDVPKVFIPNAGNDPEQLGMTLVNAVRTLQDYLSASCDEPVTRSRLLQYVLLDSRHGSHVREEIAGLEELGIHVIDMPLVTRQSAPLYDPERIVQILLSLV